MTTINGKKVPDTYRSLENLPGIIAEMERYGDCSDRNGNLDRNEALCVVNYVGDEIITVDDYQLAQAHSGLSSLVGMTPRQFKDLCSYFGKTFESFPPYVEYQKDDKNLISRKEILFPEESTSQLKKKIAEVAATFVNKILVPTAQVDFFEEEIEPRISKLSLQKQWELYQKLAELDPATSQVVLADQMTQQLTSYGIGIYIDVIDLGDRFFYRYTVSQ